VNCFHILLRGQSLSQRTNIAPAWSAEGLVQMEQSLLAPRGIYYSGGFRAQQFQQTSRYLVAARPGIDSIEPQGLLR
jgi:hypothetical protein